jgi:hypothetical protein
VFHLESGAVIGPVAGTVYELGSGKNTHRFPIMSHRLLCIPNYTNQDRVCISKAMRRSKRRKSQQ